jgi:hypothetical protein
MDPWTEPHVDDEDDTHIEVSEAPLNPAVAGEVESERIAAAAAAVREAASPSLRPPSSSPAYWTDVPLRAPMYKRNEPQRATRSSWPWVLLTTMIAAAAVAFFVVPQFDTTITDLLKPISAKAAKSPVLGPTAVASDSSPARADQKEDDGKESASPASGKSTGPEKEGAPIAPTPATAAAASLPPAATSTKTSSTLPSLPPEQKPQPEQKKQPALPSAQQIEKKRATFDQRLAALDARGAGVWGGADFAAARTRAAEAVGANDAGRPDLADKRLDDALRLLGLVESRANQALESQLSAGDEALTAGQGEVAKQAFDSARLIDPNN